MPAFLVCAGIVDVVLSIVMHIHCFPTNRAAWIFLYPSRTNRSANLMTVGIWRPLMPTLLTLVLLMTMCIFSVAIKVHFVVAFRAAYLV